MIDKLNIENKQDSPAKQKLIASGDISTKETLTANEINELTAKTNELVDAYNFGTPITGFNWKGNKETYADLLLLTDLEVNDGYGVIADGLVYVWNGEAFQPEGEGMNLGLRPDENSKVEEGNLLAVSGGEVSTVFNEIGVFIEEPSSYNPIEPLFGLPRTNLETNPIWGQGHLNSSGEPVPTSEFWMHTRNLYPLPKGWWRHNLYMQEGRRMCLYDENENLIETISISNGVPSTVFAEFYMPVDGFFRFSYPTTIDANPNILSLEERTFISVSKPEITDGVFVKTETFGAKIQEDLKTNYGVDGIVANTEFIEELIGSSVDDESLWRVGFLIEGGGVEVSGVNWYHTVKFYKLPKGVYNFRFYFSGNARAIIYDLDGNIKDYLSRSSWPDTFNGTFTINEDSLIRFSHREDSDPEVHRLAEIFIKNSEYIRPAFITSLNKDEYISNNSGVIRKIYLDKFRPKKKRPLVTIISDDCHVRNDTWFTQILDQYNVKATFAVIGLRTVEADNGTNADYFNSERLVELYKDGHDLASHTWTHTNNLISQGLEVAEEELSRTKVFVERLTDTPCNMFVSPFGVRNSNIDNLVSRYYDANFISGYSTRNEVPLDNFFLNRVSFDSSESDFSLLWNDRLKPAVDSAIANNEWVIFAVHPQYLQYRDGHNPEAELRRTELNQLIEYCIANDVEIVTAKKGYEYFKNFVNIGVRRYDSMVYQLGMDGSEYNLNYFE